MIKHRKFKHIFALSLLLVTKSIAMEATPSENPQENNIENRALVFRAGPEELKKLIESLQTNKGDRKLKIYWRPDLNKEIALLAKLFHSNNTLERITIMDFNYCDVEFKALIDVLKSNRTLIELVVPCRKLNQEEIDMDIELSSICDKIYEQNFKIANLPMRCPIVFCLTCQYSDGSIFFNIPNDVFLIMMKFIIDLGIPEWEVEIEKEKEKRKIKRGKYFSMV